MLAKCLIINVLRLIIVILFFIAFLNITYVARHTWATTARNKNVPLSIISAGMGHSSERTTLIYLTKIENSVIDEVNKTIIDSIKQ
ncbi:site-specific integrase [Phocaeicola vulgatus]|uniref:integrase n=1 Tax=Phocaeicola vulgatus TaxID=821 RepID=UPI00293E069F|nr:integrase [Phocaeicola vulgatus]